MEIHLKSLPKIQEVSPEEFNVHHINSIQSKYPKLRQASKGITFAAQYFGTYLTFMENSGLSEELAKQVEANYKELYKVSVDWNNARLNQAETDGYVTCAFGLRVRTPILAQTLSGKKSTPKAAEAERRSAGNALTQSYGLLNSRAADEFRKRLRASRHSLRVKIVALIHDAIYLTMEDRVDVVEWVNHNLIECMSWCELSELYHPEVKLGAELDLFYNGWHQPITLPNKVNQTQIQELVGEAIERIQSGNGST